MQFAVETWDPAYGASDRAVEDRESSRPVDVGAEVKADRWSPIDPDPGALAPSTVVFVDGVRRIDARIWITEPDGTARPGVCATVAAGAVLCTPTSASVEAVAVRRGLYTSSDQAEPLVNPGGLGRQVVYEVRPVDVGADETGDEAAYLAVHNHMTEVEHELSSTLNRDTMVVVDGPLARRDAPNVVGYVKTQHVHYLEPDQRSVLARLDTGQRTPLFRIGGQWPTWSWYLRLPGLRSHALSGIVRLELPALGDPSDAAARADEVSVTLPRFASEPHKDSRAPQNLYPIAGLERQLRRHLGDPKLLERALRLHARTLAVAG